MTKSIFFGTNMPEYLAAKAAPPAHGMLLRRKCLARNRAGSVLRHRKHENHYGFMQRRAVNPAATVSAPSTVHDVVNSTGQPLDRTTRTFMESRFDRDFSRVRVHHDARATRSAAAVNALAYTVGQDIVFGAGQYAPASTAGRELLAHELAHTVQQAGTFRAGGASRGVPIAAPGSKAEREADRAARSVLFTTDHQTGVPDLSSLGLMLARVDCTKFSYRQCIAGVYKCGYRNTGTCGWGGIKYGCRCMGADQPSASRVLEVLAILGLSLLLVITVIAALADPEPATKLLLGGLSAAEATALLLMLGYSEQEVRDMGLDPSLASAVMPGGEERTA
jgi:hypothetical protein